MKVIVTDGDARAALAVTRSLGRAGHTVLVGAARTGALAHASRHCARAFVYPDPMQEPMAFVTTIAAVAASVGVEVVVPVADVATMLISAHRDQLPAGCRVPFGDIDVVSRAADKARLIETARRIGVPVPESVTIGSVHEVPDDVTFPIVVKPWRSRIQTTAGWLATSVSYAADRGELLADLRQRAPEEFPVMLQERIEGPGIGVFACCRDGVPTAMFSHRRIRERPPWAA